MYFDVINRQWFKIGVTTKAGEIHKMNNYSLRVGFVDILRSVAHKILNDDFDPLMGVCFYNRRNFRGNVIKKIEQDILVLLVAMDVIKSSEINRYQQRFTGTVIFQPNGKVTRRFVTTDAFRRTRPTRSKYR